MRDDQIDTAQTTPDGATSAVSADAVPTSAAQDASVEAAGLEPDAAPAALAAPDAQSPAEDAEAAPPRQADAAETAETSVTVTICGAPVALACEPGDGDRLRRLGGHVADAAAALAEAGLAPEKPLDDPRFLLMCALSVADALDIAQGEAADAAAAATAAEARARSAEARADAADEAALKAHEAAEAARAIVEDGAEAGANTSAARKAFESSFAEIVTKAAKRLEAAASRLEGR